MMTQQRYLTYQYKAHTRRGDFSRLAEALRHCATLYNAALQERTQAYPMQRKSVTLYDQTRQLKLIRQDLPEWSACYLSLQAFFKRVGRGEKPGYPHYRSRHRYRTLEVAEVTTGMLKHSQDGSRAYIRIKGLPTLTLRTKRPLPGGKPKTLMISRRATGYVVSMAFAVEREALPESNAQVRIDMGVNERIRSRQARGSRAGLTTCAGRGGFAGERQERGKVRRPGARRSSRCLARPIATRSETAMSATAAA